VRLGLRAQILVALLLVTLGGIFSVGLISIWRTRQALAAERYDRVQRLTAELGRLAEGQSPSPALAERLVQIGGAEEVAFLSTDGKPMNAAPLDSDTHGRAAALAGMAPHAERIGDEDRVVLYAAMGGHDVLRATFTIDASIDRTLRSTRTTVLFLGALNGLVLLVAAAWILRGAVVRPVLELERAAQRVAAGDLEARVSVRGPGELDRLANAFDRMTESLRTGRESLIRSEKLASVGRLAAGVAHEVGNPLAAILGYVEVLRGDTPEKPIDPSLRADMLDRVRAETERIHRIIQELLDYSRPPRDEAPEPVDVAKIADGALSLVKAQSRHKEIQATIAVPADLPRVRATPSRLTQVMLNLLLNAADATEGKGTIVVDARAAANGRMVIGVSDDGPGVPADLRGKIFDPFFTTKDPGRGTGLGLSVCLAIVEGWGGALRLAERSDGKPGARFEVDLPIMKS
jgi:signal transduction histidine kinase